MKLPTLKRERRFLRARGFTIVELLIVIVIIGVLAALVIVAYRGIQQRANNAKTVSAIQAYKKALIQYATEKGTYPLPVGYSACLGEGYPGGTCFDGSRPESATFNNNLRPYLGNGKLPLPNINPISSSNLVGAFFYSSSIYTLDGQSNPYFMAYLMDGAGTKCPVGPIVGNAVYPDYSSTPPSSGYTSAYDSGVRCSIALPDPSTY